MTRSARFVVAAIVFHVWPSGCVDTSPLHYTPLGKDGGLESGVADGSIISVCNQCITNQSGPCNHEYAACVADERCSKLAQCALETGCFTVSIFQKRIECATPCLKNAGILAGNDPSLNLALNLNACTLAGCRGPCVGADAGDGG